MIATVESATLSVSITASIKDMLTHAAKQTSRYAINGVLIERKAGRAVLAATDGHRMAIIEEPPKPDDYQHDADDCPDLAVVVPADAIKALAVKMKDETVDVLKVGERPATGNEKADTIEQWQLSTGGRTVNFDALPGNFPPYRDVIPSWKLSDDKDVARAIGLNPQYLADAADLIHRFAKRLGEFESCRAMKWSHQHATKPVVLDWRPAPDVDAQWRARVVLMPVTLHEREDD